jgi:hypothetical protein
MIVCIFSCITVSCTVQGEQSPVQRDAHATAHMFMNVLCSFALKSLNLLRSKTIHSTSIDLLFFAETLPLSKEQLSAFCPDVPRTDKIMYEASVSHAPIYNMIHTYIILANKSASSTPVSNEKLGMHLLAPVHKTCCHAALQVLPWKVCNTAIDHIICYEDISRV